MLSLAHPGVTYLSVGVTSPKQPLDTRLTSVVETFRRHDQQPPDPIQRIAFASAVHRVSRSVPVDVPDQHSDWPTEPHETGRPPERHGAAPGRRPPGRALTCPTPPNESHHTNLGVGSGTTKQRYLLYLPGTMTRQLTAAHVHHRRAPLLGLPPAPAPEQCLVNPYRFYLPEPGSVRLQQSVSPPSDLFVHRVSITPQLFGHLRHSPPQAAHLIG
jgi:hypothetical protein